MSGLPITTNTGGALVPIQGQVGPIPLAAPPQVIRIKRTLTVPSIANRPGLLDGELAVAMNASPNLVPTLWVGSNGTPRVLAGSGQYESDLIINRCTSSNAVIAPEANMNALLHLVGEGPNFTCAEIDSYGAASFFRFRIANGTLNAPTAVPNAGNMGGFTSRGYTGAAYNPIDSVRIVFTADTLPANTTMIPADTGTSIRFDITPQGSNTTLSVLGVRGLQGMTTQGAVYMGDLSQYPANMPTFGNMPDTCRIIGYNNNTSRIVIDTYRSDIAAPASQLVLRRSRGTQTSATAAMLLSGDQMGAVQFTGVNTPSNTATQALCANIACNAIEPFSGTNTGCELLFATSPLGGVGWVTRMDIRSGVIIPDAAGFPAGGTGGDMGAGHLNVKNGIWINGVAVSAGTGGITSVSVDGISILGNGVATPLSVGTVDAGTF
jgi:hypothetical protein